MGLLNPISGPQGLQGLPGIQGPIGPDGITGMQINKITTDGSGNATWTFPTPYTNPPTITALAENSSSEPMAIGLTAVSANAVSINVKQARTLPSTILLLSALVSFDIFGGSAVSGAIIHMVAIGT